MGKVAFVPGPDIPFSLQTALTELARRIQVLEDRLDLVYNGEGVYTDSVTSKQYQITVTNGVIGLQEV